MFQHLLNGLAEGAQTTSAISTTKGSVVTPTQALDSFYKMYLYAPFLPMSVFTRFINTQRNTLRIQGGTYSLAHHNS